MSFEKKRVARILKHAYSNMRLINFVCFSDKEKKKKNKRNGKKMN